MARCKRTWGLEVHHIRRDGGNALANARVLCQQCHEQTPSYGTPGRTSADFDEDTKERASKRAGGQCECPGCESCHK
jgi:5-methylcytosine-specific restriction endonuclease McrA